MYLYVCTCVCVFMYVYLHHASFLLLVFLVGLRSARLSFLSCYLLLRVLYVFYLVHDPHRSFLLFLSNVSARSFILLVFLSLVVSRFLFLLFFVSFFLFFFLYFIRPNLHLHTTKLSRVSKIRINRLLFGVDTVCYGVTIAIVRNTS